MANNKYNRRVFIFSAMEYLRERNFDGLDIDWEFPKGELSICKQRGIDYGRFCPWIYRHTT